MAGKPDKQEHRRRVQKVFELMLRGQSTAGICRYVSEETDWDVGERTVERYMAAANKLFEAYAETIEQREMGRALARQDDLYRAALAKDDLRSAIAAEKERHLLLGLYAPTKTELTGAAGGALKQEIRFVWDDDAGDHGGHGND